MLLINANTIPWYLIHWGQVAHKCVSKLPIFASDNGLVGDKLLSEPMLEYFNFTLRDISALQWNVNRNSYLFSRKHIRECRLWYVGHFVSASICQSNVWKHDGEWVCGNCITHTMHWYRMICKVRKPVFMLILSSLEWRHNGRDSVSNHQSLDCLLNRLLKRRPQKTLKLSVTGLCASNAESVSIWWRHYFFCGDLVWNSTYILRLLGTPWHTHELIPMQVVSFILYVHAWHMIPLRNAIMFASGYHIISYCWPSNLFDTEELKWGTFFPYYRSAYVCIACK